MKNYDNFNVLEINLEDSPSSQMSVSNQGATYEEAFLGGGSEEMSNAKGKGRARRKKRKLERISAKREVRTERRKLKGDRQEERIARRKKRKEGRQEIRDEQMEARQERRNKRMEMKEARKGKPEDEEEDDVEETTKDTSEDKGDDTGSDNRSDEDTDDTGSDSSSDEDEDEKGDGYYGDDVDSGQSDAGYDDDNSYNKYPTFEEEDNFDGETSSFVSEVTGKKSIPAPIQQICLKIEWNNEMLDRLSKQKKKMQVDGVDTQRVDNAIDQKFARNQELEGQLEQFIGADGSKAKVVSQAKRKARAERILKVIPPVIMARMIKKGYDKSQIKEWWQSRGAKKYSSMNGEQGWDGYPDVVYSEEAVDPLNYFDTTTDYDTNMGEGAGFDPMSFANGEQSGGNNFMRSLIIGLIIGGVTIYVIRKYQLLK